MEIWDLYDENKNITGKDWIRGNEIPDNYYHLVVHVWVKNDKGEYLISQRSADRQSCPLMWECSGGSVLKGESSLQAAIRETKEEIGVDLLESEGKLVLSKVRKFVRGKKFNDIVDIWLFRYNGDADLNKATTKEVADVKWMNKNQIKELFETKELVQTLDYFFNEIDI